MHKGEIFCFRVKGEGLPVEPFGPLHKDLTQAKVWAKSQPIALGEIVGYAEVRLVAVAESVGFVLREVNVWGLSTAGLNRAVNAIADTNASTAPHDTEAAT